MVTVLERFVVEQVGHVELLDRTRQTATSRVLHVRDTAGRRWFAKRLTRQWSYSAEASAYDVWGHLPQVPRLRASCAARRCLLLPAVPGRPPSGQDPRVLRRAGVLLRTLHEAPAPAAWPSEWREVARDVTERRLAVLDRAGVAVDAGLVREHLTELLALVDLPEVPTHGDFQPHNWRWHRGRLHTFDFAGAALRPAAYDLSRLRYAACWHDPGLFDRLLAGYGRDLTSDEQRFLVAALPWRALVALCVGTRFGRPRMVGHAHRVLDSLAAGRHWGDR